MKRLAIFLSVLTSLFLLSSCVSQDGVYFPQEGWSVSYEEALSLSQETGKPILMNFTGRNWCEWCQKLEQEIFLTPQFLDWAREHVILLELDYPYLLDQSEDLLKQNEMLKEQYQIKAFPTVIFIDGQENILGYSGYVEGGAEAWISRSHRLLGL